jgi:hypothetical protein
MSRRGMLRLIPSRHDPLAPGTWPAIQKVESRKVEGMTNTVDRG